MPRDGEEVEVTAWPPLPEDATERHAEVAKILNESINLFADNASPVRDWRPGLILGGGSIHTINWGAPSREAVDTLKQSGRISQAYGRKVLANALIRALRQRPEDFTSTDGHRGYLQDEESGQRWDLEYPLHIQMLESSACVCHELDLGPWHSLRVWFAVARWRKHHGDYRAHMEEALRLQAMEKDPC